MKRQPTTIAEHLEALRAETELHLAATRGLADGLTEDQLAWSPERGRWGLAQLFDHLVVSYARYRPLLETALREGPRLDPRAPSPAFRPSRMGRWLVNGLRDPTRRLPAPAIFRPAAQPEPGAAARLIAMEEELLRLIDRSAGLDLNRTRTRSPVTRFLRLNLGDALEIQVVHIGRHLGQAERLCAHAAFPAA